MEEIWKPVPGVLPVYYASSLGRIKMMAHCFVVSKRLNSNKRPRGEIKYQLPEKILICRSLSGKGYIRHNMRTIINGKICIRTFAAHRIVAAAFLGQSELQVNHINGVKTDNRIENLEYVTNQQNRDHAVKNNLHPNRSNGFCKVSFSQIAEIRQRLKNKECPDELALEYGVKRRTIISYNRKKYDYGIKTLLPEAGGLV